MKLNAIKNLFIGQAINLNNKTYFFHKNGQLEITGQGSEPVWGEYRFSLKKNIVHLFTSPPIFEGKKEFPVEIVLDGKVSLTLYE